MSTISFDIEPPVWPSKSHSIRGGGADWTQNACLGWSRGTWYTRVHGFRVAAELLANHVAQTRAEQDGLIFPFLYNWRQHIELALKELIIDAERLLARDGKRPEGHNLDGLWQRCRKALEAVEPKAEARSLDHAGRLIGELHAMDPRETRSGIRIPARETPRSPASNTSLLARSTRPFRRSPTFSKLPAWPSRLTWKSWMRWRPSFDRKWRPSSGRKCRTMPTGRRAPC